MIRLFLKIVIIFFCFNNLQAQIFNKDAALTLDSACAKLGLSPEHDFWLPIDYTNPQKHLLKCVKKTLDSNLFGFTLADEFNSTCERGVDDPQSAFFKEIIDKMEFREFNLLQFTSLMPKASQREVFGDDTQSITKIANSLVLQDFMAMMIQAQNILKEDPLLNEKSNTFYLMDKTDSIFINSSDASGDNPIETRKSELSNLAFIKDYFSRTEKFDNTRLINVGISVYIQAVQLALKLRDSPLLNQIKSEEIITPFGKIAIGGPEDNTYIGDYILIIDVGGNDVYNLDHINKFRSQAFKTRLIVDISGDDKYLGGDYSLGGSYFGNSILLDFAGNDLYSGGDVSLGASMFGVGILHDYAGNDLYKSGTLSQGASAFGIGLLIDDGGNDQYSAISYSQGFGYTKGFGLLRDQSGNDTYSSIATNVDVLRYSSRYVNFNQGSACGVRPVAAGGIGMIIDYVGNDIYNADIFGQASAYWFSYAAIVDNSGDDRYSAHQYAQGAGIHLATGILADLAGNDVYYAHGVSLGCGHDLGFGGFIDKSGDDSYSAGDLSLGSGNANAISLFLDLMGNDIYQSFNESNTFGYSDYRRYYGFFGIFADGNGDDKYSSHEKNGTSSFKSSIGLFDDEPTIRETPETEREHPLTQKINPNSLPFAVDSLLPYASALLLSHQKYVDPARDKIIDYGTDSLSSLMPYFDTELPRERLALELILDGILKKDSLQAGKMITDSLTSSNIRTYAMCALALGKNKIKSASGILLKNLHSEDVRIKAIAAEMIGHLKIAGLADSLASLLSDKNIYVRARAGYAISELNPPNLLDLIAPALRDSFFLVRYNTLLGIEKSDSCNFKLLKAIYSQNSDDIVKLSIPMIFSAFKLNKQEIKKFAQLLQKCSNEIRYKAYMGMDCSKSATMQSVLKVSMKIESDVELQKLIEKLNSKYE